MTEHVERRALAFVGGMTGGMLAAVLFILLGGCP